MLLHKNGFLDIYFMTLLVNDSVLNLEHYRNTKNDIMYIIKVRINFLKITIIVMEVIWNLITNNYYY